MNRFSFLKPALNGQAGEPGELFPNFRFFHDQLPDDRQRAFYEAVETAVCRAQPVLMCSSVPGLDPSGHMRILEHVYDDHPECLGFFPLGSRFRQLPGGRCMISLCYRYDARTQAGYLTGLEAAVRDVLHACFPQGWAQTDELRREKAIFDWITRYVVYNHDASALIGEGNLQKQAPSVAWNAYGALVERSAVCEGIACAFKLLCDQVGLPCIVVLGHARTSRHAWNMVRVHGKFYHVDCTWDLSSTLSREIPYARYRYFNLPDSVIRLTHTPESAYLPVCGSMAYNPFRLRGLCAEREEELLPLAMKTVGHGAMRFALMALGFSIPMPLAADTAERLSRVVGRRILWYLDDSGCFAGFAVEA